VQVVVKDKQVEIEQLGGSKEGIISFLEQVPLIFCDLNQVENRLYLPI